MAELFSQYASGVQFSAGTIVGSVSGVSGLNPIVDRLNSISDTDNNLSFTGSIVNPTTSYISKRFIGAKTLSGDFTSGDENILKATTTSSCSLSVSLPQGAVIDTAMVYASNTGPTWYLKKVAYNSSTPTTLATASGRGTISSIDETVNNNNYSYYFLVTGVTLNVSLWTAEISYTTDYD